MKSKQIKQTITINSSAYNVYDAWMDQKEHTAFTGFKSKISDKVGGAFNTCGNRNWGYNLHLEPGRRIIQAWRQEQFEDNRFSIIDLTLERVSPDETIIHFNQFGAPEDSVAWLKEAWIETYWEPLKLYLEKGIKQKRRE